MHMHVRTTYMLSYTHTHNYICIHHTILFHKYMAINLWPCVLKWKQSGERYDLKLVSWKYTASNVIIQCRLSNGGPSQEERTPRECVMLIFRPLKGEVHVDKMSDTCPLSEVPIHYYYITVHKETIVKKYTNLIWRYYWFAEEGLQNDSEVLILIIFAILLYEGFEFFLHRSYIIIKFLFSILCDYYLHCIMLQTLRQAPCFVEHSCSLRYYSIHKLFLWLSTAQLHQWALPSWQRLLWPAIIIIQ